MATRCPMHANLMPFEGEFFVDPYPTYARMHRTGPAHRICVPGGQPAWLITRYEEASEALKDCRLVRSRKYAGSHYSNEIIPEVVQAGNLHMEDGPVHTRLRRLMNFAFMPKRVEQMIPRIKEVTTRSLDIIADAGGGDIMSTLAAPLPITIISDILGVPVDARGNFRKWSDEMLVGHGETASLAGRSLLQFVVELIAAKRRQPADDLISYWIEVQKEDADELSDQEMLGMVFFLLLGGYDTTVGQIGASVLALIKNPDMVKRLRVAPELIQDAVEELMRWDGSTHTGIRRFAAEDLPIGKVNISAGDTVLISLAAANRDPERFEKPEILDFDRPDNIQLGFGRGPHNCPGKELARLELRIALGELVRRFPDMTLAVPQEHIVWRPSYIIRVPQKLPITV